MATNERLAQQVWYVGQGCGPRQAEPRFQSECIMHVSTAQPKFEIRGVANNNGAHKESQMI